MLVWARVPLKQSAARLNKKCEKFALMTSFDLEDVKLGSPNLYHKEFLCGPTQPPSFVFLAFLGAEIAGGQNMPPSGARNSQTLSRGRVNPRPHRRGDATPASRFCALPPYALFLKLDI